MRHFYRSVFVLGLMILPVLRSAGAQTQAPATSRAKEAAKVVPQGTAKTRAQAPAKSAAAQAATAKPAPLEAPQLKFEKYKLDNGLEVIFSEDHRLQVVAVNLWDSGGRGNAIRV